MIDGELTAFIFGPFSPLFLKISQWSLQWGLLILALSWAYYFVFFYLSLKLFKSKKYFGLILTSLLLLVLNGFGLFLYLKSFEPDWHIYQFDKFHFSIESPFPLKQELDNTPKLNDSGNIYISTEMKVTTSPIYLFYLTIRCSEYTQPVSLEKIKDLWKKQLGAALVRPAICSGLPAIELYNLNDQKTLITTKGRFQWYFSLNYSEKEQENGKNMADRVFNSIKIND